jgi:hypothetical protein
MKRFKRLATLLLVLVGITLTIGCASFNMAPMVPTSCEMEAFAVASEYGLKTDLPTKISCGKSWNNTPHAVPIALYKGEWMQIEKGFNVEGTRSRNMGLTGMDLFYVEELRFTKREFFNLYIEKYLGE